MSVRGAGGTPFAVEHGGTPREARLSVAGTPCSLLTTQEPDLGS